MKNMEEWFAEQDFNTEDLPRGHRNRFFEKLEAACEEEILMSQTPPDEKGDSTGNTSSPSLQPTSTARGLHEMSTGQRRHTPSAEDKESIPIIALDKDAQDREDIQSARVIPMINWVKWSLVAGLALLLGFAGFNYSSNLNEFDAGLESVSPEMAQAQDFFTSTINHELAQLNKKQSPETERIIADAKIGLKTLETEYQNIKKDFKINQDNKTVIAAMIENFQSRINLLKTALEQIEQLKELKELENEIIL